MTLSVSDQFADEEVASQYVYPAGFKARGIAEQVSRLRALFPDLGTVNEKLADQPLPSGADEYYEYYTIPRWERIAATYNEAVEKVVALIAASRNFYNYRAGKLGPDQLRQHTRKVKMMRQLSGQQQGHDILVVSAQLGMCHRGRSVRRAREVFAANEFGLGAYEVGIILLTHPERLVHADNLWMDCAGDEFAPVAGGRFSGAPCFRFGGGGVGFGTFVVADVGGDCGSASGLLPQ